MPFGKQDIWSNFADPPTECGMVPVPRAGTSPFWSAAGSEAPRRFGFGTRAPPELALNTAARRKSKAPSPLRSADALQNQARPGPLLLRLFLPSFVGGVEGVLQSDKEIGRASCRERV